MTQVQSKSTARIKFKQSYFGPAATYDSLSAAHNFIQEAAGNGAVASLPQLFRYRSFQPFHSDAWNQRITGLSEEYAFTSPNQLF